MRVGDFIYQQREGGEWFLKGISAKKEDGTLKKKYKDLPRVKQIYFLEDKINSSFEDALKSSIFEFINKLK